MRAKNRFVKNGTANFGWNIPTEICGPPPEVILNIPVKRNRNGPFHLNSDRNYRNLWHNGKHPFFQFARLENSQKNWKYSEGSPVFPVGTSQWKFVFHLQNFSSLQPVPCLSRLPWAPSCFQKMAGDPSQVSGSFLQTNFRATTSALPATF